MQKKFFVGLIFSTMLSEPAHSINQRGFYESVEDCLHILQGGNHFQKETIRRKLNFVEKKDLNDPELKPKKSFKKLYKKLWAKRKRPRLLRLAKYCKDFYDEGDETLKLSAHLLLQRVSKKYIQWKKAMSAKAKELKALKREEEIAAILNDQPYPAPFNRDGGLFEMFPHLKN